MTCCQCRQRLIRRRSVEFVVTHDNLGFRLFEAGKKKRGMRRMRSVLAWQHGSKKAWANSNHGRPAGDEKEG